MLRVLSFIISAAASSLYNEFCRISCIFPLNYPFIQLPSVLVTYFKCWELGNIKELGESRSEITP